MAKEVLDAKPVVSKKLTYSEEVNGTNAKEPLLIAATERDENAGGKRNKKSYEQMIIDTITENDPHRKGLSFVSIKKTITGKYTIDGAIGTYVKKAFEKLTSKNIVERVSGTSGINGSIRFTKAYTEGLKKQQKILAKPKPKAVEKAAPKPKPEKPAKDKNNNEKKKGGSKVAGKVKQPALHAKLSTKKTAITKTKIARSGGKVRLSIVTPGTSMTSKAKLNASKTSAGTKSARQNGRRKDAADGAMPKSVKERK